MKKIFFAKAFATAAAIMMMANPISAQAQTPVTASNFDANRYADSYPDLKAAFGYDKDLLWTHYANIGASEGRVAHVTSGDVGYLAGVAAPAVATSNAGVNASNFDANRYANDYADLKAAFGYNQNLLWSHYVNFGSKEGRKAYAVSGASTAQAQPVAAATNGLNANNFDANRYANDYADLKAAFGYNKDLLWSHYANIGSKEGRKAYAIGGAAAAQVQTAASQSNFVSPYTPEMIALIKKSYEEYDRMNQKDVVVDGMVITTRNAQTIYTGETKDLNLVYKILDDVIAVRPTSNRGDCQIFSDLFYEKALSHGFTSSEVGVLYLTPSKGQGHAWNKILVNGTWYQVDAQKYALGTAKTSCVWK